MTTPQISATTVLMNPAEVSSHAQTAQIMTVAKAKDAFTKAEEKAKSDSVNISREAIRMAKDAQETANEPEDQNEQEEHHEISDR